MGGRILLVWGAILTSLSLVSPRGSYLPYHIEGFLASRMHDMGVNDGAGRINAAGGCWGASRHLLGGGTVDPDDDGHVDPAGGGGEQQRQRGCRQLLALPLRGGGSGRTKRKISGGARSQHGEAQHAGTEEDPGGTQSIGQQEPGDDEEVAGIQTVPAAENAPNASVDHASKMEGEVAQKKNVNKRYHKICDHADGCHKIATFGDAEQHVALRCKEHKHESHIDVLNHACFRCSKRATFGIPGQGRPVACAEHREASAVDLRSRTCAHWDGTCRRIAFFGEKNQDGVGLGRFCKQHKLEHHVDVRSRKCQEEGCMKQPSYGSMEDGRLQRCKVHMLPGHQMLRGKRCREPGCEQQPSFGSKDEGVALYCGSHSLWGHVDIRHRSRKAASSRGHK